MTFQDHLRSGKKISSCDSGKTQSNVCVMFCWNTIAYVNVAEIIDAGDSPRVRKCWGVLTAHPQRPSSSPI